MENLKISAIIVGRNEGKKLEECLKSLSFCDDILYADLNSSDNSLETAEKFGCRLFKFEIFGPSCEYTQSLLIDKAFNDWVILIDPDEKLDKLLVEELLVLLQAIHTGSSNVGAISVPWRFYFANKRLKGTVWGYRNEKVILVNRNKFEIKPITHYGRQIKPGYSIYNLRSNHNESNVLHHYWMDDIKSFWVKHFRYLKDEGKDRFKLGYRIGLKGIFHQIFHQFYFCFILKKGYRDGFLGFFLSCFWTFYQTYANVSLYFITKRLSNV